VPPLPLTRKQRQFQYALVTAGLMGGAAAILTLVLTALVLFSAGGARYGQPMALYRPWSHLTPFVMPHGALDGGAWLMLLATYAGLLIAIPAFFMLLLGGANAD
jgi:hypothetical protein